MRHIARLFGFILGIAAFAAATLIMNADAGKRRVIQENIPDANGNIVATVNRSLRNWSWDRYGVYGMLATLGVLIILGIAVGYALSHPHLSDLQRVAGAIGLIILGGIVALWSNSVLDDPKFNEAHATRGFFAALLVGAGAVISYVFYSHVNPTED